MHPFYLVKRLVKFTVTYVVLFTMAFCLTVIPSTLARQPQIIQTTKSPTTTPQQLIEQGEALYQAGRFAEAVTVLQQAVRIYEQKGDRLTQATALTNLSLVFKQLGSWQEA